MVKRLKSYYFLMLISLTIVGCSNVPKGLEMEAIRSERFIIHPDLEDEIAVISERIRPVGVLPQAEVTLKNFTEDRYTIEYRIDWYDQDGFKIETLSSWNRLTLTPNGTQDVRSVGKSDKAVSFKMNIRLPDDVFIVK